MKRQRITKLKPRETIRQKKIRDDWTLDCSTVHEAIRKNAGISKAGIVKVTGLDEARVTGVIRRIQQGDTETHRVEYANLKAGFGWYTMKHKQNHPAIEQAHRRDSAGERGFRRRILIRLGVAEGYSGEQAAAAVQAIQDSLGESVELMSAADFAAFEELLMERFESGGHAEAA